MSTEYYLSIVAYRHGVDWQSNQEKPYHWMLFIRTSSSTGTADSGIVHQLHGMPGGFNYDGPEEFDDINKPVAKCLEVDIGRVPHTEMDTVTRVCSSVAVIKDENTDWNCQSWSVTVVERLKELGFIDSWVDEAYVRGALKEMNA